MILDLIVEAIFPFPVPVVSGPWIVAVVALLLALTLVSASIRKLVVPLVLESGDLVLHFLVILGLRLAVFTGG